MEPIKILSPQEQKNISDSFLEEYLTNLNEFMLDGMDPSDLDQYRQAVKDARAETAQRREAKEAEEAKLLAEKEAEEEKKRQEQADNPSSNGWERDTYIDTNYSLQTMQEDQSKRGTAFLVLAGMLAVFYLAFSVPYWLQILNKTASVNPMLGEALANNVLFMHLGLTAAALLFNFIAIFSGKSLLALIAAMLYALAILPAPTYVIYVGLQSLFCVFGALRKHSMKKAVQFFRGLLSVLAIGIVGLTGMVRFDLMTSAEVPGMDQILAFVSGIGASLNPEDTFTDDENFLSDDLSEDDISWLDDSENSDAWEEESEWWDEDLEDESEWMDEDTWNALTMDPGMGPNMVTDMDDDDGYDDWSDEVSEDDDAEADQFNASAGAALPISGAGNGLLRFGP